MSDIQEDFEMVRKELAENTDAFGSMTLDGVYQTASNMLIAHYLKRLIDALEKRGYND